MTLPATTLSSPVSSDLACAAAIERIGWIRREKDKIATRLAEATAKALATAEQAATPLIEEEAMLEGKIAAWANAERARLTKDGTTKTAEFASGLLHWRMGRGSVEIDDKRKLAILAALKRIRGFSRFIKVTEAPSKSAMLSATEAERKRLGEIKGIRFVAGEEALSIVPAGAELADRPEPETVAA